MSLGISLNKTFGDDFRKLFWLVFTFALATPVGIALGIGLGEAPDIVDVIFSCLAGGTFVYIACSEVIVEEFSLPGNKWIKLLFFMMGPALITCLWFLDS
jgi:zinc transporter 1/2/3